MLYTEGGDRGEALAICRDSDACILVLAAGTRDGRDRKSLKLPQVPI